MKKAGKYLLVVAGNALVLCLLLFIWADEFYTTFNIGINFLYFIYIIGISFICLTALYIASIIMRKRGVVDNRLKIKYAIMICLIISSYYYVDFSIKIINGPVLNSKIRKSIVSKTQNTEFLNGIEANGLTIEEYNEIRQVIGRPVLPASAQNIYYAYDLDLFLGDFGLTIRYEIPLDVEVELLHIERGGYSKERWVEFIDDKQIVTYQEIQR